MNSRNAADVSENLTEQVAAEPGGGSGPSQAGHIALLSSISIGQRISGMAGVLLLLSLLIGGFSVLNVRTIGTETGEVADRDIPLADAIVRIETKQLEQAIIFERAARFGVSVATDTRAKELFIENKKEFEALAAEVNELVIKGEEMAREAIAEAPADESETFELILSELEGVEASFATYVEEIGVWFGLLESNRTIGMQEAMGRIEVEADVLDREFLKMREQIEEFSRTALQDAVALANRTLSLVFILSVVSILVGVVAAVLIIRGIVGPIAGITHAMGDLSEGDLTTDIHGIERGDEIGAMAKAVEIFKKNAIERQQLIATAEDNERAAKQERTKFLHKLAGDFEAATSAVLGEVTAAADQVKSSATAMSATADQTNQQSTAVAAASEEASGNVQTVASASEELASSIGEISRQVEQSSRMTTKAVSEADAANTTVQGLADAASSIGDVVELINNIAAQTNLLALNATIEAARAGEAGKGFAVVASEVKSLANQTAKATEEISSQISTIQKESSGAVEAIDGIRKVISEVDEIAGTIAAAVEEQGAATQEIARNVQQASAGTQDVSSNIAGVTQAAGETGQAAAQVLELSNSLTEQADKLSANVEKFLADLKSA